MSHAPADALSRRHQLVRAALSSQGLDGLIVTSLPNVRYLTNFSGSSAIVVLLTERLVFVTDFRYISAVTNPNAAVYHCPGLDLVPVESSYDVTLASVLSNRPRERIGFEGAHLSFSRHAWLHATLASHGGPELTAVEGLVEQARATKDSYELAALRRGAGMLSSVATEAFGEVRRGRTEREVAAGIEEQIRKAGFERPAFETIVAAGPNAALPHAKPSERRLDEGDVVVLDFGGVYDSYCVDLTRTVTVGRASDRARHVHAAVLEAHDQAIAAVRPGASRFAIDEAARGALAGHGFASAFGHGTGHGLGLEVHEDPRIVKRRPRTDPPEEGAEQVLPGMVFTVEPGAYFPGWGGVRIEDDVLVTQTGAEVLTQVTTDLLEL